MSSIHTNSLTTPPHSQLLLPHNSISLDSTAFYQYNSLAMTCLLTLLLCSLPYRTMPSTHPIVFSFPCSWNGITCDSGNNHIIAIKLSGTSLAGTLPTTIGCLSSITTLTSLVITNSPNVKGYLPTQLGLIASLAQLTLQGTSLSGSIPHSISGLIALTRWALT